MKLVDIENLEEITKYKARRMEPLIAKWISESCEFDTELEHEKELQTLCWNVIEGLTDIIDEQPTFEDKFTEENMVTLSDAIKIAKDLVKECDWGDTPIWENNYLDVLGDAELWMENESFVGYKTNNEDK